MAEKVSAKFSVRPAAIGDGYRIVYFPVGAPQIQINYIFATEGEANSWILSQSAEWLQRFGGRGAEFS